MFTGIVESLGQVVSLPPPREGVARLEVFTTLPLDHLDLGASVAVNGVCLTLTQKKATRLGRTAGTTFSADLGPETLALTSLGGLEAGDDVHLERAVRMGDSLGGHLVAGHVDGLAKILRSEARGEAHELACEVPAELALALVPKGSVTLDGVSLTVNWVKDRTFGVMLIPHTLACTTLGRRVRGDRVNIETDLMAKHVIRVVERYMEARYAPSRAAATSKPSKVVETVTKATRRIQKKAKSTS